MEGKAGALSATNKYFLADETSKFTFVAVFPDFTGATVVAAADEEAGGVVAADTGTDRAAAATGTEAAGFIDKILPVKGRMIVEAGTASPLF